MEWGLARRDNRELSRVMKTSVFGGISKISIYICQNSLNCTLKVCAFHYMQIVPQLK